MVLELWGRGEAAVQAQRKLGDLAGRGGGSGGGNRRWVRWRVPAAAVRSSSSRSWDTRRGSNEAPFCTARWHRLRLPRKPATALPPHPEAAVHKPLVQAVHEGQHAHVQPLKVVGAAGQGGSQPASEGFDKRTCSGRERMQQRRRTQRRCTNKQAAGAHLLLTKQRRSMEALSVSRLLTKMRPALNCSGSCSAAAAAALPGAGGSPGSTAVPCGQAPPAASRAASALCACLASGASCCTACREATGSLASEAGAAQRSCPKDLRDGAGHAREPDQKTCSTPAGARLAQRLWACSKGGGRPLPTWIARTRCC